MEQMKTDGLDVISLDYESSIVPRAARILKPIVYKDGDSFCCVFGPDPQVGVFGCGKTQEEALSDWDNHLKDRAVDHPYGDALAEFVIGKLADNTSIE